MNRDFQSRFLLASAFLPISAFFAAAEADVVFRTLEIGGAKIPVEASFDGEIDTSSGVSINLVYDMSELTFSLAKNYSGYAQLDACGTRIAFYPFRIALGDDNESVEVVSEARVEDWVCIDTQRDVQHGWEWETEFHQERVKKAVYPVSYSIELVALDAEPESDLMIDFGGTSSAAVVRQIEMLAQAATSDIDEIKSKLVPWENDQSANLQTAIAMANPTYRITGENIVEVRFNLTDLEVLEQVRDWMMVAN